MAAPAAGGCPPPRGRSKERWRSRQEMGKEEAVAAGDAALTVRAAASPTGTVPSREPLRSRDQLLLQARRAAAKKKDFPPVNNEKANPASPAGVA